MLCEHRSGQATEMGARRAPYWPVREPTVKRSNGSRIAISIPPWPDEVYLEGGAGTSRVARSARVAQPVVEIRWA